MSATSQGAFVVIPEIPHSDISYIIKEKSPAATQAFVSAARAFFMK